MHEQSFVVEAIVGRRGIVCVGTLCEWEMVFFKGKNKKEKRKKGATPNSTKWQPHPVMAACTTTAGEHVNHWQHQKQCRQFVRQQISGEDGAQVVEEDTTQV